MNANHIFLAAIENVAEIICQVAQEALHQGIVRSNRQTFQFLQVPALCAQAALSNGFDSSDKIFTMALLRSHTWFCKLTKSCTDKKRSRSDRLLWKVRKSPPRKIPCKGVTA